MALVKLKPTSHGRRHAVKVVTPGLHKGKQKRFGRGMGKRSDVRKAYVRLKEGQSINFVQEVK